MPTPLKDLAVTRRGVHLGKTQVDPANGEPHRAVKIKNIQSGTLAGPEDLDLAHLVAAKSLRHVLSDGDILVAVTGANPKVALVPKSHSGCVANQGLAVVSPVSGEARARLVDYLSSEAGQEALRGLQTGVVIPSIKTADLGGLLIP